MLTQLMTNIFIVRKSLFLYLLTASVSSVLLLIFGGEDMKSLAIILSFMLIITPSLEVMNHQSKSGYDTFILTLPVARKQVVQAHYLFYGLTVLLAFIVSVVTIAMIGLFIENIGLDSIAYSIIALGISLSLITGAVWYPSLYLFGTEKSEGILIVSLLIAIASTLGIERGIGRIMVETSYFTLASNPTTVVSLVYLFSSITVYIVSFFIAQLIYSRKEF